MITQTAPAYGKLRVERMNARVVGLRAKKAKEAAEAPEGKKKEGAAAPAAGGDD